MYLMNSTREFFHIELECVYNDFEKNKDRRKLNARVNFYNVVGKTVKSLNENYILEVEQIDLDTLNIKITCNSFLC